MKKAVTMGIILAIVSAVPVFAGEEDLLARISALEERVAVLESMLDVSSEQTEALPPAADALTLSAGTYIVGEDIPAGKYNLTCNSGSGSVKIYDNYETRRSGDYNYFEDYTICSQEYMDYIGSALGEDYLQTVASLYTLEAKNVRLEAPNCVFIDGTNIIFTPVG